MNLQIELPKIRCKKATYEFSQDEVYFVIFVFKAKKDQTDVAVLKNQMIYGQVSEVTTHVKSNTIWRPTLNDINIDLEDNDAFCVTFALYEKDDGEIYQKIKEKLTGIIDPEPFFKGWDIGMGDLPTSTADWVKIVKLILKLGKRCINYFKQDDLLGSFSVVTTVDDKEKIGFPMEYELKKQLGTYQVSLLLNVKG